MGSCGVPLPPAEFYTPTHECLKLLWFTFCFSLPFLCKQANNDVEVGEVSIHEHIRFSPVIIDK